MSLTSQAVHGDIAVQIARMSTWMDDYRVQCTTEGEPVEVTWTSPTEVEGYRGVARAIIDGERIERHGVADRADDCRWLLDMHRRKWRKESRG